VILRQQSQGKKSIDAFCKLFHGGHSGPPMVKTYTFDDVVNTLNQVVAYDWRGFWTERLTNHGPGAPVGGLEGSGWKLVYDENPSELLRAKDADEKHVNAKYSIGLLLGDDGEVIDTVEGMAAAKAGIGPGMRVIAINGRRFTGDILREALQAGKTSTEPLEFLVENADYFKTFRVDYHGGEKYPHLVRNQQPDLLEDIIRPR
jgi:predicted metalloprotease with PDZ domain